jgi:pyruvate kinase
MMNEIVCSAEKFQKQHPTLIGLGHGRNLFASMDILDVQSKDKRDANASIAKAAVTAATKHDAKAILVYSPDSSLAKFVSAYRPDVPIVVFCSNAKDGRQLIIYRGIHPVVRNLKEVPSGQRPVKAIQYAKELGFIHDGDDVVIVCVDSDEDVGDFMTMKLGTC